MAKYITIRMITSNNRQCFVPKIKCFDTVNAAKVEADKHPFETKVYKIKKNNEVEQIDT